LKTYHLHHQRAETEAGGTMRIDKQEREIPFRESVSGELYDKIMHEKSRCYNIP
jgi:hypothetical protein